MFQSLRIRNFRYYFAGQMISSIGTFMQAVAQAWLVLQLTSSGAALGILTTLQFGPLVLLGGPAGVLADRFDRRHLYLVTQIVLAVEALLLGLLVTFGSVELWMVYVLAVALGVVTAVDQPLRQTIVMDIVGPHDLTNAVSLTMALGSTSRAVGPALAGITIAIVGVGPCFLVNAGTYLAMILALLVIRPSELHPAVREPRGKGQFRAGLAYVWATSEVRSMLILIAVVFALAWEFEVALPLVARYTFDGGASVFGLLASAVGAGAVVGGLESARRADSSRAMLLVSGTLMGVAMWCATLAPTVVWEAIALFGVGASGVIFVAVASTRLQLNTIPRMRGRVMALYAICILGTRVAGGPIVGWFGQAFGPRASLAVGAVAITLVIPIWFLVGRKGSMVRVKGGPPALHREPARSDREDANWARGD